MRHSSAIAILQYFLYLLELLEQIGLFWEQLSSPIGLAAMVCLGSYESFILLGCDPANAVVLALATGLTFHAASNRPQF